jgi:PKD repeat protein
VVVSEAPPPAVRILSINPLGGVTGAEVTFTANVTGEPPLTYSWNFGGGAAPNDSAEPSPTVTLGGVNTYQASLTVENAQGSASRNFTLTVTEVPGEPPEIISVSSTEGDSGTEATFSAEVTGDGLLEYYWNFGGGASPNQSAASSPTVTLSRGGTLPAPVRTYPATLTITNPYGTAVQDFDLNISAWWHLTPKPYDEVWANALTPDGKPTLIARRDGTWFYCEYDGTSWNEQVLPLSNYYRELAYNPVTSEPVAVGVTGSMGSQAVVYARRSGGQWHLEEIEYAYWVTGTDLAFHHDGTPVVCWCILGEPFVLKVAKRKAGAWAVETVPAEEQDTRFPSMVIDGEDRVAIAYSDDGIWMARNSPDGWSFSVVADDGFCYSPEVASDSSGALLVVYKRNVSVNYYTAVAVETGGNWEEQDIDDGFFISGQGYFQSIGVGFLDSGEPILGYMVDVGGSGDSVYEVHTAYRHSGAWSISVPFPPEGSTSSWGGHLIGVSQSGAVVLTVGETGTSNKYIALLW